MAVGIEVTKVEEAGNGSKVTFDLPYAIYEATDVTVYKKTIATAELGTALTYTTDYSVSFTSGKEGTASITYVAAPTTLQNSFAISNIPATQTVALPINGKFQEKQIESMGDRATRVLQQVKDAADRSLKVGVDSTITLELPDPVAGKVLGWNATADNLENYSSGAGSTAAAEAAAATASAAAVSATASSVSATASAVSASASAVSAAASASALSFPSVAVANAYQVLQVNAAGSGYDLAVAATVLSLPILASGDDFKVLQVNSGVRAYELIDKPVSDNLLINGNMDALDKNGTPIYWTLRNTPTLLREVNTNSANSNSDYHLKMTAVGTTFEGIAIDGAATNWLKVKSSTEYTLSCWYKVTAGDTLHVFARSYHAAVIGTSHVNASLTETSWTFYTVTFTTDADADNLNIYLSSHQDGDVSFVCDVKLEEGSSATKYTNHIPSALPVGVAQGWVLTNGGTVTRSYNVASMTDNGTGDYTVTWDKDMDGTNYLNVGNATVLGMIVTAESLSATSVRMKITSHAGVLADDAKTSFVTFSRGI